MKLVRIRDSSNVVKESLLEKSQLGKIWIQCRCVKPHTFTLQREGLSRRYNSSRGHRILAVETYYKNPENPA